ncbi:Silenced mating-type M-specific polypeptide Mc-like protein [Elsinoe fawcettii]|nr:Silenced mating-type M-specific polypeptide Mc-like protein [Elsinoe fawcettii]
MPRRMPRVTVLAHQGLTGGQQAIEKLWVSLIQQLTQGNDRSEFAIPAPVALDMGRDGIDAIIQRCKSFNGSFVDAHLDQVDNTIKLTILSAEAKRREDVAQLLAVGAQPAQAPRTIPRPRNCFILYRQHHHEAMVALFPKCHNNQISQIIGRKWRSETQAVRDEWKAKADLAKIEHERMYPGYAYQPRRPGTKKRRAARTANTSTATDANNTEEDAATVAEDGMADQRELPDPLSIIDNLPIIPELFGMANNVAYHDSLQAFAADQAFMPPAPPFPDTENIQNNNFQPAAVENTTFNTNDFQPDAFPDTEGLEAILSREIDQIMNPTHTEEGTSQDFFPFGDDNEYGF